MQETTQGSARCKYFGACGLPVYPRVGDDLFCILHLPPGPGKDVQKFDQALVEYLADGRSDFRWVYFPLDNPSFQGRRFTNVADFRNATFSGMLNLNEAVFDQGLLVGGTRFANVDLSRATVRGPFRVEGRVNNTLRLNQATLQDLVEVRVEGRIHIQSYAAQFHGRLSIDAPEVGSLELHYADLRQGLTLRGRCESRLDTRFDHATIRGHLDLRSCDFGGHLLFGEVVFDAESTLDLSGSRVHGELVFAGLSTLPRDVELDGAIIDGNVRIEAVLGARRPRIVAASQHPRFGGLATFTNVDLRNCLLVGNVIDRIELSNVDWPRLRGRYVLRDEIVYRETLRIPPSNLREAYQVLKQKYQTRGDHVRAGDFHYGEMEMKRREYGFPWRWLSWEFIYWMLSGYGVGHVRASLILVGLVFGFAWLYYGTSPGTFANFSEALRYSVAVAALQRPETPASFGESQRWLHLVEAILGPLQIGFFALALRMRLKR